MTNPGRTDGALEAAADGAGLPDAFAEAIGLAGGPARPVGVEVTRGLGVGTGLAVGDTVPAAVGEAPGAGVPGG